MTMISPQSFVDEFDDESYATLLKERDKLIRELDILKNIVKK